MYSEVLHRISVMRSYVLRQVGPKKAREMWFLSRFYTASEAEKMGLVNTVVPVRFCTVLWPVQILIDTFCASIFNKYNLADYVHAIMVAI